ncbi:NAD(P)-dependent oxidoreductase [Aeromicrobium sp. Root495]|uniref:SDR family oxidoreductase n=1 Tax=Aeromicrobium sp. Root495 TaxID=1736550 RepID=UPI00070187CA|nr:SDR family oxidoreductase [Aeromicrobium sp. Root495]KQY58620.1 NAD(P)-dependent oxidoreductase [Aeromicrobium sp. Root495]
MTIAVTGASGQLGTLVTQQLVTLTDPSNVVLVSRSPEKLSGFAGTDARRGDFSDPTSLADAFAGVDTLLLISTDDVDGRLEGHLAAIDAAVAAGVQRIVYTSVTRPEDANPAQVVPSHAATEKALRDSGVAWTLLRNNLYADMQRGTIDAAAATGQLVTNIGEGRTAYVTREDCAAVAAHVLVQDGHENQTYDVTGPEAVGADDLAALASKVSGSDVAVVQVDDAGLAQGLVEHAGLPAFVGELLASFGAATRGGFMGEVTTVVEDVTGQPATPFAQAVGLA